MSSPKRHLFRTIVVTDCVSFLEMKLISVTFSCFNNFRYLSHLRTRIKRPDSRKENSFIVNLINH